MAYGVSIYTEDRENAPRQLMASRLPSLDAALSVADQYTGDGEGKRIMAAKWARAIEANPDDLERAVTVGHLPGTGAGVVVYYAKGGP